MTPDDFQKFVTEWLTAISAIMVALTGLVIFLAPRVAKAIESVKNAHGRLDDHSRRITNTNDTLVKIALATPTTTTIDEDKKTKHETTL